MAKRFRISIDLGKRVESSKYPPIIVKPKLPTDMRGFDTVGDLISRQTESRTAFPFQRELALFLLLIASIWPGDLGRLIVAARIFSGALNFHISPHRKNRMFVRKRHRFHQEFTSEKLNLFNKVFFARIGGLESLLFCQSVEEFHCELWARTNELAMMHDVIEFLIKTARYFPEFCSSKFAFNAIAHNVFGRIGGYGVAAGPKRKHLKSGLVTTPELVRAKWKNAPDTIILSYILTHWYSIHFFDAANPLFLIRLNEAVREGPRGKLIRFLSLVQEPLHLGKAKQNSSIMKWLRIDIPRLQKPVHFKPLTPNELDQLITISRNHFKKPLTPDQEADVRARLRTWWRQIPRTT